MAAGSVGSLFVNIVAKTSPFTKGLKSAQSRLTKFKAGVVALGKKVLMFGGIMTGVALGGMVMFARSLLTSLDTLGKTSAALGMTTAALSELEHAASITGVSNDQLATGLRRMEKTISDASVGLSTAKRALGQLELTAEQLNKLKPEEQFAAIGEALKGVASTSLTRQE